MMPTDPKKISTQRMITLIDYAVQKGMADDPTAFLVMIGFPPTNYSNVKKGLQGFTRDHIYNACVVTGANMNWVFDIERNMMRKETKDPVARLKELTIELEALINKSSKAKSR